MSLGQRVRKRRRSLNINQKELAKALNVTPQHISAIEKDKKAPSLIVIAEIAKKLGVSIDYLASGKKAIITDTIPAIKASDNLKLNIKKALLVLIEEIDELSSDHENSESI